jgi:hypothetical protein
MTLLTVLHGRKRRAPCFFSDHLICPMETQAPVSRFVSAASPEVRERRWSIGENHIVAVLPQQPP